MRVLIQRNLGKPEEVIEACQRTGTPYETFLAVPFSDDVPEVPDEPYFIYGAVNLLDKCRQAGLDTFITDNFLYSKYIENWCFHVLNCGGFFTTIGKLRQYVLDDQELFIRPDADLKSFSGEVVTGKEYNEWFDRISHGGYTVGEDTRILVMDPLTILREWRLFFVDGRLVASTQYKQEGRLAQRRDVPDEVKAFGKDLAAKWSPAPAFVLDVCQEADHHGNVTYRIVEAGAINSAGFYAADIDAVIVALREYLDG